MLFMPAEGLDLIDVGDLESQQGEQLDAENGGDVAPGEAVRGHHVAEIDDQADEADERKFDQPHRAGEHDRRIGALVGLRRGRRRQRRRIGARQCRHCRRYRRGRLKDLAGSRLGDDRHVLPPVFALLALSTAVPAGPVALAG
ncbi:MAG TPA: hypothetical protein VNY53_17765 [Bradyrhizobium sp.]|nr:hypothetical protein [Bradyrhizobium sp.]